MYGQDDQKQGGNSKIDKPTLNQGYAKGGPVRTASYAEGGAVLGRTREFLKEPSPFRSSTDGQPPKNQLPGKGGEPTTEYAKKGKGEVGKWKSDIKQVTCK